MSYHYSNPSSLHSAAPPTVDDLSSQLSHGLYIHEKARIETTVQGTEHGGACWSALNPLPANLCERVKTGLRAVRGAAGPHPRSGAPIPNDRPEAAFSALGGSVGLGLFLAQMPPDAPLPTIVWANPQQQGQSVTWG
jgi:hypothetical protein